MEMEGAVLLGIPEIDELTIAVVVCCRVLQSVAECCRVLQSVAECCSVLQCWNYRNR